MNKKVVVLGGGTGVSTLLKGLKEFPIDINAVVSVCDDGKSTGRLRKEFKIPAVGDIRKVLVSLSATEPLVEQLLNYRFKTTSDLNGHTVGNILLTALTNITGNMSDGIESLGKVLNLKGKVLPLTEDNVILMGKMSDGSIIEGEHNITSDKNKIESVFYKEKPIINPLVINSIINADLIILSMGSIYTSILPNLICDDVIKAIDESKAKIFYVCNMMTQPGETDGFMVSDHVNLLNSYLGERKIDVVIANNSKIDEDIRIKYETLEQKDQVLLDIENINSEVIQDDFIQIQDETIRHNYMKLAFYIFSHLLNK
ncbi:MAG TPA: YvcK family protein [Tenericutes bacterium]|nr:YvcK family protein [Mycoplasmatota bacterium]